MHKKWLLYLKLSKNYFTKEFSKKGDSLHIFLQMEENPNRSNNKPNKQPK